MPTTFRIPKLTDREIVTSLGRVCNALSKQRDLRVGLSVPHLSTNLLPKEKPEDADGLKFILDADSQVIKYFHLHDINGQGTVLGVNRRDEEITDQVTIPDDFSMPQEFKARFFTMLLSEARKELRAPDVEAALKDHGNDAWNRYRDAQLAVINSLQQATETVIIKAGENNAALDNARSEKFAKLETDLRAQLDQERKALQDTIEKKNSDLVAREKALAERESTFNTKEARYVARQKQQEQIEQVRKWLDDWNLTKGTTGKRAPIFWGYIAAMLLTIILTGIATWHNYTVLSSADVIAKLLWWQWAAITLKSVLPLAAFTTFMIYFIRWSSAWARQHAEEEFRNRTRLIDIGRSSWLLEAVRDAQQNGHEIPSDLLHELSRNLFSSGTSVEPDLHPQAISDVLLQGLASVRVKTPDGSEVEAKREGKK